jgi:hypothetical protein
VKKYKIFAVQMKETSLAEIFLVVKLEKAPLDLGISVNHYNILVKGEKKTT